MLIQNFNPNKKSPAFAGLVLSFLSVFTQVVHAAIIANAFGFTGQQVVKATNVLVVVVQASAFRATCQTIFHPAVVATDNMPAITKFLHCYFTLLSCKQFLQRVLCI